MSRLNNYVLFSIIISACFLFSCQKDNYEEPEINPKTYSFSIPNKVNFKFSQISENSESVIPYTNTLSIKNVSNNDISGNYVVFAFRDSVINFDNLSFLNHGSFETIATSSASEVLSLENSDDLFNEQNLIASILNFGNPDSDHNLNGLYTGELNIFTTSNDELTFIRSITCTGIIDFEGQFQFLIHNPEESDVVRLKGNFNSNNLVSGNILNRIAENLSAVMNVEDEPFILTDSNLTGSLIYTENTEERILKFNLTKQN